MRGGSRPGAGRKRKDNKAVTVSFTCSPDERSRLEADVLRSGLTRSEYIRRRVLTPSIPPA